MGLRSDNERKKQYLQSYRTAMIEERILRDEIRKLRADKMFPGVANDGMPRGSGGSDLSGYAARLDDLIQQLQQKRMECVRLYEDIQSRIMRMEDDTERAVMMLRYMQCKRWEDIAQELAYSLRTIHHFHSRALVHFKIN